MLINNAIKIHSMEYLEESEVYDIEVPLTGNFILENGVIAHNCSHAVSYGIVSYNGAYLKHFFGNYFWIGMLTIAQDDTETMKHYLQECGHLILPISISKSHPTEWAIEGDMIRPPLNLLKGCGGKTVTALQNFINTPYDQLTVSIFEDSVEEETV